MATLKKQSNLLSLWEKLLESDESDENDEKGWK
jgi:hypothetical protein